jgi:23S rRNA (cytosine1962-C5)-methyltransferase
MPSPDPSSEPSASAGYALLDAGEGRRLERFGARIVDRPAPTAMDWRRDPEQWRAADLRFDPGSGWSRDGAPVDASATWPVAIDGLSMEVRPTASGGLGLYPEHASNLEWLNGQVSGRLANDPAAGAEPGGADVRPTVLNLFAHTGLLTLGAARAGGAVAHVDAARSAVAWARRNADLSGLGDRPIRWLVDDASAFVAREARRARTYDGIVLDPPSVGHAGRRRWRLEDELPDLVSACARVLATDGFLLLTAHTTGLGAGDLAALARGWLPSSMHITTEPLELLATSGARLSLGWALRAATG